ncbi:MAG: HD domain-containing protein [Limnochordia bacterium]|nr:HD domain-containing protein [Limnochordia bacterium]MDD2628706.1 HD domain-containing protein [Limnochordia bacterium]MDD4517063.1 HD domain-containing protein [Limnochordia bacterium]
MRITLKTVKENQTISAFLSQADQNLAVLGFTEHGFRHANLVAQIAGNILDRLDYPKRQVELAEIAGYCHDIGNLVSRLNHGGFGACLLYPILKAENMSDEELAIIISAVGNHEEDVGSAVTPVSAALILADKSDVHRTRVRNRDQATFDIHDRVSFAAVRSFVNVDKQKRTISLELSIQREICPVMEYFEIFLSRMIMCRRAAELLDCQFKLEINGACLL